MGSNYYLLKPSCVTRSRKRYDVISDPHNVFIHVGRRTNNTFIWNIDPDELKEYELAGCQPYFEGYSITTWECLRENVFGCANHDYYYVGKGVVFF